MRECMCEKTTNKEMGEIKEYIMKELLKKGNEWIK